MFDVSSQQSFDSLHSWLSEMKKEIGDPADMDKVVFVVCANKVTVLVDCLIFFVAHRYHSKFLFQREKYFLDKK